jgi:SMI1 / KNR4 family (SUKH-1)
MSATFWKVDRSATEEQIGGLELLIGYPLPSDYRRFLGGGLDVLIDHQHVFILEHPEMGTTEFSFGDFRYFEEEKELEWNDIVRTFELRSFRPTRALEIGFCAGDQRIFLSLAPETFGMIFYFVWEDLGGCRDVPEGGFDEDDDIPLRCMYPMASSFADLVEQLRGEFQLPH